MPIDENEFFRKTITPLSGILDFKKAIPLFLEAIGSFIPADGMIIHLLEPSLKSNRLIIESNSRIGIKKDIILPITTETRNFIKSHPIPDMRIINRPEKDQIHQFIKTRADLDWSGLAVFLYDGEDRFAHVLLCAYGTDRYSENDLKLFSLLRNPLALALMNYMRQMEISYLNEIVTEARQQTPSILKAEDIIGHNQGLSSVVEMASHVATLDSPVILLGETGVGKDLIANFIHNASNRKGNPFIKVNCGAMPETLVDSELFGHEKGAFTGATARRFGRFERANSGTIFLDEIGELAPNIQIKLLRVLENQEIDRLGGNETIKIDVRIITATNRNMESLISSGKFREDLWFRINVFPIMIPPLRMRKSDIAPLVDYFIKQKSKELKIYPPPRLARNAIDKLISYSWPGNVRELINVIERALILSKGSPLTFNNLSTFGPNNLLDNRGPSSDEALSLDHVMAAHIQRVLKMTNGRINGRNGAAELLNMRPNTLRYRMRKLGIEFGRK